MARPRDPELDQKILDTLRMLVERDGPANVTMSGLAKESGVSRPSIYRRWPSLTALMFEAQTSRSVAGGFPDKGSFRAEMLDAVARLVDSMVTGDRTLTADQLGQMIQRREFSDEVWANRWGPDIDAMYLMWERALQRGEVDATVDGRAVMEDLVAHCIFQVMLSHRDVDTMASEKLVDRLIAGLAPR